LPSDVFDEIIKKRQEKSEFFIYRSVKVIDFGKGRKKLINNK